MPLFSIIIPVYNAELYLSESLESVLAQTVSDYEIIVVNDGSTDSTGSICDEYAKQYNIIKTLHIENQGASHARNIGISYAQGEFLLFLDADDLWKEELLSTIEKLTLYRPDIISFGSEKFGAGQITEKRTGYVIPSGESGCVWLRDCFAKGMVPPPYLWSYAYRRKFLLENNLFLKEHLVCSEDFDFNMRAIPLASRIDGVAQVLYRWRQVPTSLSHTLTSKKLLDNLQTKAEFFDQFPCGALANIYMDNAVLLSRIPRADAGQCVNFLKSHQYIEKYCTQRPLKLASRLFSIFGYYKGSHIYELLRQAKRRVQH